MHFSFQLPIRIDLAINPDLLNEYPTPMSNMREAEWRLRHHGPRMERGALTMRKHLWLVGRPVDSCGSNSDPFVAGCDGPCLLLPLLL